MTDSEPPQTDEELAHLLYRLGRALGETRSPSAMEIGHRVVREIGRLRSDEWLEKAAADISSEIDQDGAISVQAGPKGWLYGEEAILAILRKHRDATASMDRPETGGSPPTAPRSGSTDRRGGQ